MPAIPKQVEIMGAVKKRGPWTSMLLILVAVGLADAAYLAKDAFAKVPPVCPTYGILQCGPVTSSTYSHPFGIPVALLGFFWFAVMFGLCILRPSFYLYVMLPFWLAGMITVGYLIYVELFLLDKICLYCTLAHICAALMGIPVLKLSFSEEDDGHGKILAPELHHAGQNSRRRTRTLGTIYWAMSGASSKRWVHSDNRTLATLITTSRGKRMKAGKVDVLDDHGVVIDAPCVSHSNVAHGWPDSPRSPK